MQKGEYYKWEKTGEIFHFIEKFNYEHILGKTSISYILMTPVSIQPWILSESSINRMKLVKYNEEEFKKNIFTKEDSLSEKAKKLSSKWSVETNHLYDHDEKIDGIPYTYHTHSVKDEVLKYKHLLPENKIEIAIAASYLHDSQEDQRLTFNNIKEEVGEEVAMIVAAVSNDWGLNRTQRAGEFYYKRIRETPGATYIKICDRLANVKKGFEEGGSSMLKKYAKEHENFKNSLKMNDFSTIMISLQTKLNDMIHSRQFEESIKLKKSIDDLKMFYNVEKDWYEEMWVDLEKMLGI